LATLHIRARNKLGVAGITGWTVAVLALAGMGWMSTTRSHPDLPIAPATLIRGLPAPASDQVLVVPLLLPPEGTAAAPETAAAPAGPGAASADAPATVVAPEEAVAAPAGPGATSPVVPEESTAVPPEPATSPSAVADAPSKTSSRSTKEDAATSKPRRRPRSDET